jgi:hypothetical protein
MKDTVLLENNRVTEWERHGMCESSFKTAGEQHGMCESALICVFVGFSRIFLLGILIFKRLAA